MLDGPYSASVYSADPQDNGPFFHFTPPTVNDIPWYEPDDHGPMVWLYRHFRPKTRGVNVFILSDGTIAQDTATPENSNSAYPLPWILNDPSGPYSYTTNWDLTVETASLPVWIEYCYYGGHTYTINQFEANYLTSTVPGYSSLITSI
jgi:hypothetical protein